VVSFFVWFYSFLFFGVFAVYYLKLGNTYGMSIYISCRTSMEYIIQDILEKILSYHDFDTNTRHFSFIRVVHQRYREISDAY
jgi:hypothetical protein